MMRRFTVAAVLLCASPALAQSSAPPAQDDGKVKYEDQVVVSASRTEQELVDLQRGADSAAA